MVGFPGSRMNAAAERMVERFWAMSFRSLVASSGERGEETMMSMSPYVGFPGASIGEPT